MIALIEEATRCRDEAKPHQTPAAIRNTPRRRARVLKSSEIGELITAYKAGESTYVLAQRFGIRRETVAGHLERQGIMRRGKPRIELDTETHRMIIELGVHGTPASAIAKRFGLTDRVVARTLDSASIR